MRQSVQHTCAASWWPSHRLPLVLSQPACLKCSLQGCASCCLLTMSKHTGHHAQHTSDQGGMPPQAGRPQAAADSATLPCTASWSTAPSPHSLTIWSARDAGPRALNPPPLPCQSAASTHLPFPRHASPIKITYQPHHKMSTRFTSLESNPRLPGILQPGPQTPPHPGFPAPRPQ